MRGGNGNAVVHPPPFCHSCENGNPYRKNFFCKVEILHFSVYNRIRLEGLMLNPSGVLFLYNTSGEDAAVSTTSDT